MQRNIDVLTHKYAKYTKSQINNVKCVSTDSRPQTFFSERQPRLMLELNLARDVSELPVSAYIAAAPLDNQVNFLLISPFLDKALGQVAIVQLVIIYFYVRSVFCSDTTLFQQRLRKIFLTFST